MTPHTRKRILIAGAVGLSATAVTLMATVGASARDNRASGIGAQAARTSSQAPDQVAARKDHGGHDGQGDDENGQGRSLLRSTLAPSVPTDPAIHAVVAGGVPWVIDRGSVRLKADGGIRVEIKGLVIPIAHGTFPAGTALPVTTVSASLYCAPDSSGAVATTAAVAIAASGDATIADTITLPALCLAPIVLVHPNGGAAAYIAATGWSS